MYQELWRIRSAGLGHKVYYPRAVRRRSKFFVVKVGRIPGLYYDYHDALEWISGFSCAFWKSFTTLTEALVYQRESDLPDSTIHANSAAVRNPTITSSVAVSIHPVGPLLLTSRGFSCMDTPP